MRGAHEKHSGPEIGNTRSDYRELEISQTLPIINQQSCETYIFEQVNRCRIVKENSVTKYSQIFVGWGLISEDYSNKRKESLSRKRTIGRVRISQECIYD